MAAQSEPGIRRCIACDWLFVTPDHERVRRCSDCKQTEERQQARAVRLGETLGSAPRPSN